MTTAVIIDYGSGNLHSAHKAFDRAAREHDLDVRVLVSADPKAVLAADHIILPGVGAFAACKRGLDAVAGMRDALDASVRQRGRPFLGICVGMQLMAERGLEFVTTPGLGWIKGDVKSIEPSDTSFKVPHMGWNSLDILKPHPLLSGINAGPDGDHAYFVHSFHLASTDRSEVLAETNHGGAVTAMVGRDNIAGTQFHPEKSQALGLRMIANFLRWRP
jgi:imidazole glycerol-phosphate synthase subunit HisH